MLTARATHKKTFRDRLLAETGVAIPLDVTYTTESPEHIKRAMRLPYAWRIVTQNGDVQLTIPSLVSGALRLYNDDSQDGLGGWSVDGEATRHLQGVEDVLDWGDEIVAQWREKARARAEEHARAAAARAAAKQMKLGRPVRPAWLDRLTGAARRSAEAAAARAEAAYARIEAAMAAVEKAYEPLLRASEDATALAAAARAYQDYKAAVSGLRDLPPYWREAKIEGRVSGYDPAALLCSHMWEYAAHLGSIGIPVPPLPPDLNHGGSLADLARWCDDVAALGA